MSGAWQDTVAVVVELGVAASRDAPPSSSQWNVALWDVDGWASVEPYWVEVPCREVGGVTIRRGRGRVWHDFEAGTADIELLDEAGRWTFHPSTAIAELELRSGSPARIYARHAGVAYPLWRGYVETITEQFVAQDPVTVALGGQDPLAQLARYELAELGAPIGAGDTADLRIGRLLDAGQWPEEWRVITPSDTPVAETFYGRNTLEEAQEVAFTDGGYLFGGADGTVVYHGPSWVFTNPESVTVQLSVANAPGAACPAEIYVTRDADDMVNEVTLMRFAGDELSVADPDSVGLYGPRSEPPFTVWNTNDDDVVARAEQLLGERSGTVIDDTGAAIDQIRVERIVIHPETMDRWPALLALDIGHRIEVTYTHPRHGWTWHQAGLIQLVRHQVSAAGWVIELGIDEVANYVSGRWDDAVWDVSTWATLTRRKRRRP